MSQITYEYISLVWIRYITSLIHLAFGEIYENYSCVQKNALNAQTSSVFWIESVQEWCNFSIKKPAQYFGVHIRICVPLHDLAQFAAKKLCTSWIPILSDFWISTSAFSFSPVDATTVNSLFKLMIWNMLRERWRHYHTLRYNGSSIFS